MAIKQNTQVVIPALTQDVAMDPRKLSDWWGQVKFGLEQVLPGLVSNVNELVDGSVRLHRYEKLTAAPVDVEEGWVAFADGTNWNPGAGAGLYEYNGGVWVKL